MQTVVDAARRHPRWVDAGLAVLLAVVNGPAALAGSGVEAVLCYVAVHVPLVWRRAAPVAVFWAVLGLATLSALLVGVRVEGLYPEMLVAVAVYTVARYASRRHLVPIVLAVEAPAVIAWLINGPQWTALGFVTAVLAATVLLGLVVRTRRAYLAELEERARRLERDRDQRAEIAVAAERARIARDLHDIVAHHLSVMVTLADAAALTATAAPEPAADAMRQVSATGRQALAEMRRLVGVLHDGGAGRDPQPGLGDLDALVAGVRAAGVRVALTVRGTAGDWGPGVGLAVYRIVQEALTNTLKHAGPGTPVTVGIGYDADGVEVEVTDEGPTRHDAEDHHAEDHDAEDHDGEHHEGHGMTGMAQRAAAYGGVLRAGPREDAPGWRVHARLRVEAVA